MDIHKNASSLPAVEVAHPGASYNPSFSDHQVVRMHECNLETQAGTLVLCIVSVMMHTHSCDC